MVASGGGARYPHAPDEIARVGRYVIKRRLGAGGMGVVFEASDPELGRAVAIKMLRRGASAHWSRDVRLRREAQALAKLDHPNVVSVYDVGEHDGQVFVAMALVDGSNLRDWLTREQTTEDILRVLLEVAREVIAAHDAGLIHRDLKPDNIFIAKDGNVLVGDFGLATENDDDQPSATPSAPLAAMSLTQTGHLVGTPAYMAPEQAAGDASEKSDQFSFCVTAYEALFGTRPFIGQSVEEILDKVESGELAKPRRTKDVPPNVAHAIRRGLAADPALRFESMKALVAAMTFSPPSRHWVWLAAGIGALAIAGTAFVMLRGEKRDPVAECAPRRADLDTVWNPARHSALIDTFETRGWTRAAGTEVATRFDELAARWLDARVDACAADVTGATPRPQLVARNHCLDLARQSFEETIDAVEQHALDLTAISMFVAAMPSVDACESEDASRLVVAIDGHAALMREIAHEMYVGTLEGIAPLRARAEQLGDTPAQLELALVEARMAIPTADFELAESALHRGLSLAEALGATAARTHALAVRTNPV